MRSDADDPTEFAASLFAQIYRGIELGRSIGAGLAALARHAAKNGGLSNVGIDREIFLRLIFWDYANRAISFLDQASRESGDPRTVRIALQNALSQIDGMIHPERQFGELDKLGIDLAHVRVLNTTFNTVGMSEALHDAIVLHSQGQDPTFPITITSGYLRPMVSRGAPEILSAQSAANTENTATPAPEVTGTRRQPRRPRRSSGNRPRPQPRKPKP